MGWIVVGFVALCALILIALASADKGADWWDQIRAWIDHSD